MFKTFVGALSGEEGAAFLRPETAHGMFVNFKNVLDSTRGRIPFGIAQVGKASETHHVTLRFVLANSNKWKSNFLSSDSSQIGISTGVIAA